MTTTRHAELLAAHYDLPLAAALRAVLELTTDDMNRRHAAFVAAREALRTYDVARYCAGAK